MRWLDGHTKDVRSVAYLPDGRLVSGGSDKTVRVWDPASGECLHVVKAPNVVYAVAASPDGKTIAYAGRYSRPDRDTDIIRLHAEYGGWYSQPESDTNTIQFHNLTNGRNHKWVVGWSPHRVNGSPPRSIWSLSFSNDGRSLAAAGRYLGGGKVLTGGGAWWTPVPPGRGAVCLDTEGYAVAAAPTGPEFAFTRRRLVVFGEARTHARYPLTVDWSVAVAFLTPKAAVIAANSFLYFVDPIVRHKPMKVRTRHRFITALAVSPDGRSLFVGGKPGAVEEYDPAARALRRVYDFGVGGVHALAVAPDGGTFAVGGDNGVVVADRDD